jgi:murein DD-endopeptidase MepM/ murein hydrolase activator NlpD
VCSREAGLTREPATASHTVHVAAAKPKQPAKPAAAPTREKADPYTVVHGDTLSQIAEEHAVKGGWPALYRDNREVVGDDPDLIFPGQHLHLAEPVGGTHPAHSAATATKPKPATHPAPAKHHEAPAKHQTDRKAAPKTTHKAAHTTGWTVPVHAAIGTGYHVGGASWASGYHTGVDFLVGTGTAVHAAASGTVVTAGWGGSYGYQVVIRHADGYYSQYGHLSQISVKVGQHVNEGQRIARSGATGNATGPHLHFEVRTGPVYGDDVDPLRFLRSHGVSV